MTDQQDNEKKSFMKKNPWIIIPGILIMGYLVFTQLSDMTAKKKEKESWNKEDTKVLVDRCILDSKEMAEKYPELTKEYCECLMKKIQASMTKAKYIETTEKSIDEQKEILLPLFQNCLTEYQTKIKATQDK